MANFNDGVKRFIEAEYTVKVRFPVDWRDNEAICCKKCQFLAGNERFCQLNKKLVEYPEKYVGSQCPLTLIEK